MMHQPAPIGDGVLAPFRAALMAAAVPEGPPPATQTSAE